MTAAFAKMATVTASTKRPGTVGATGKRTAATTQIASLQCTPLDPMDTDTARRTNINTPYDLLITFCEAGQDIRNGDILTVSGKDYPIRAVDDWVWQGSTYLQLTIEKQKAP